MEIFAIETGNLKLDGGACFGIVPKSLWQKKYPADENNLVNMAMRCMLIKDQDRTVLIDCGMGNKMDERLLKHYFLNGNDTLIGSLEKINIHPDDITDVIFTHLHFDHCGGAVVKDGNGYLSVLFKNATHWVGKDHWELAMHPNKREKSSFMDENYMPVFHGGHIKFVSCNCDLSANVSLRIYNGHTQGQIIPFIKYKGKTLVYMADFIPTAAHIPLSYICGYDINAGLALEEKELFLKEALDNDYTLFFEHDLYVECCSLQQSKKGALPKDTFTVADFCAQ